jgi:cytochrome c biogenesis protein CcdA/thiol-disulfide isomerase/thioredoxin
MVLLIAFAFVAGAGTALSPCVLPVLPVVLSAGATGGRRRPLGIVTGLALSFTFATVALVYVIDALGLPSGLPRTLAIVVLIGFGVLLLIPPLAARFEARISFLTSRFAPTRTEERQGFGGGLLIGLALGLVYAPCAGPILAGVITVSASQSFEAGRLAVALAYGIGSAVVLYFLALGGRRIITRLSRSSGRLQIALGAVMICVGIAMFADLDTRFETAIASDVPDFLVNPTKDLEDSGSVQKELSDVRGRIGGSGPVAQASGAESLEDGKRLPVIGTAPELVGTQEWFNTPGDRPLSLAQLRGKVVLVDFWTYSCINCIRTLPYLNAWYSRYHSKGFEIVGVHTPEFPFEHSASNVQDAISQDGIHYPVVQDNDYETWSAYGNQYWPAEYLIDGQGRLRLIEFGEGGYAEKERAIRSLLAEDGARELGSDTGVHAQGPSAGVTTPETYFGAARAERFTNGKIGPGARDFGHPSQPPSNHLAYAGRWTIAQESATAGAGASISLAFHARRVFVVLGSEGRPRNVTVLLDGKPIAASEAGDDVRNGSVRVRNHTLYTVVDLPSVQSHVLTLEPQSGVKGYAFTFG